MNNQTFLDTIKKNEINKTILKRLPQLEIPDSWLVAGSLFQSVWNDLTNRPIEHGIRDYDVFYYDCSDLSWEAENKIIAKVNDLFSDLDSNIEIRNQARVHLWYQEKYAVEYPKLSKATDGIDRFLAKACQVGVKVDKEQDQTVYCPNGYTELYDMIISPNRVKNFNAEPYKDKAKRWKKMWPELTILY